MSYEDKLQSVRAEIERCIEAQRAATSEEEKLGAFQGEMDWRITELDLLEGRR